MGRIMGFVDFEPINSQYRMANTDVMNNIKEISKNEVYRLIEILDNKKQFICD